MNGFWGGRRERAFFDVRIFNPHAPSNGQPLAACYRKHENSKKRAYEQRVREIEHGSFTPIVLSLTEDLVKRQLRATGGSPPWSPKSKTFPTAPPSAGSAAYCHSPPCGQQSSASEALDPPVVGLRNILSLPWTWHPQRPGSPLAEFMSYILNLPLSSNGMPCVLLSSVFHINDLYIICIPWHILFSIVKKQ